MSADWLVDLARNSKGVPYPNHANAVYVLQHDPTYGASRIWYDAFLDRVIVCNSSPREWRDDDDTRVCVDLQDRLGIRGINIHAVSDAVRFVARQRSKHVVRDWLLSLSWDGIERIAHAFTDYWGASDDEYTHCASRNFFVGMVARVLVPGCKLDTMCVFEGPQGIKKSTALEILGGDWYSISHESIGTKDFLQGMRGKWLLEIAELHSFAKADVRAIKNTLSTRHDDYRRSHGRNVQRYPRECVFAGTSNPNDWGNDETGLRRFWPVACGELRIDLLSAARDQLFAEAVHLHRDGTSWWEMPAITAEIQADRQHHDEWTFTILEWCRTQPTSGDGVLIRDILTGPLKVPLDRCDKGAQMRVARVLKIASWERKKVRDGNITQWKWSQPGNIDLDGNAGNAKF